jgi:hypothetical protein
LVDLDVHDLILDKNSTVKIFDPNRPTGAAALGQKFQKNDD